MKKQLVITIDEIVLKKAKENIPNLSKFIEECLKHYLGLNTGEYPVHNAKELLKFPYYKVYFKLAHSYGLKHGFNHFHTIKSILN